MLQKHIHWVALEWRKPRGQHSLLFMQTVTRFKSVFQGPSTAQRVSSVYFCTHDIIVFILFNIHKYSSSHCEVFGD